MTNLSYDLIQSILVGVICMTAFLGIYGILNAALIIWEKLVGHGIEDYFPDFPDWKNEGL